MFDRMRMTMAFAPLYVALVLTAVAAGPAIAADPIFPRDSRIGLVPPPGFIVSADFTGFVAPDLGASIILADLPANVFDAVGAEFTAEELAAKSMTLIGPCGPLAITQDHLCSLAGQLADGQPYRKWLVLVKFPKTTAYVIVNVPEAHLESGAIDPAAIDAALATLSVAPAAEAATEDPRDALPFTIADSDLLPFRQTLGDGAAVYAPPPSFGTQPLLIVAHGEYKIDPKPKAVAAFARTSLKATGSIIDLKITDGWPKTVAGLSGYVHEGTARDKRTQAELFFLQAVLVNREGRFYRLFAAAPLAQKAVYRPEFERILESLRPQ